MRPYSSAVILCEASNCGDTATGSGTSTEEAVVITVASIVARDSRHGRGTKRVERRNRNQNSADQEFDDLAAVANQIRSQFGVSPGSSASSKIGRASCRERV